MAKYAGILFHILQGTSLRVFSKIHIKRKSYNLLKAFYLFVLILGYLQESNAAVHSVNSDIIILCNDSCTWVLPRLLYFLKLSQIMGCCQNKDLRAPLPPQIIFCPSTGLVYLVHWNPCKNEDGSMV